MVVTTGTILRIVGHGPPAMTKSPKKVDPTKETTVDGDGGSREQGSYIHVHVQ